MDVNCGYKWDQQFLEVDHQPGFTLEYYFSMKVILLLACLVSLTPYSIGQKAAEEYDDAEAYAVFSAVIFKEWPVTEAKATKLVIRLETADFPRIGGIIGGISECLSAPKGQEAIYLPLIEAYKVANKESRVLQRKFVGDVEYELVPNLEVKSFFDQNGIDGWQDFYKKYPKSGGVNELSAVGFNPDKTLAIVYAGHSCGELCGGGTYHFLEKKNDAWSEAKWPGGTCAWAS